MNKGAMFPVAIHDFNKPSGDAKDHVFNTTGPSLTRQEFKDECDINALMSRYDTHVIGGPGNLPAMEPVYADFAQYPQTLMEYMTFMQDAERAFMSLPAVVRKEFDNDAKMFVDFASDPENLEQMRTWGLAPPAKAPESSPQPSGEAVPGQPGAGPPVASSAPAPGAGAPTHGST